jgi:Transposase
MVLAEGHDFRDHHRRFGASSDVGLLADRSAATTAGWLKRHPEIEVISRDPAGLCADAVRESARQARQIADRFHLLKNLRETLERQPGRSEAPIRESPLQVEDDPGTREQIVIERSDGCSEVATQDRLLRRGRDAARRPCSIRSEAFTTPAMPLRR